MCSAMTDGRCASTMQSLPTRATQLTLCMTESGLNCSLAKVCSDRLIQWNPSGLVRIVGCFRFSSPESVARVCAVMRIFEIVFIFIKLLAQTEASSNFFWDSSVLGNHHHLGLNVYMHRLECLRVSHERWSRTVRTLLRSIFPRKTLMYTMKTLDSPENIQPSWSIEGERERIL